MPAEDLPVGQDDQLPRAELAGVDDADNAIGGQVDVAVARFQLVRRLGEVAVEAVSDPELDEGGRHHGGAADGHAAVVFVTADD